MTDTEVGVGVNDLTIGVREGRPCFAVGLVEWVSTSDTESALTPRPISKTITMRSTATFQARGARHCFAPDAGAGFSTGCLGTAGFEAGEDGNCFTTDTMVESSTICLATAGALCLRACACFEADTVAGRIPACLGVRGGRDETNGILRVTDEGSTTHSTSQSCSTDEKCSWASRDIALLMTSPTRTGTVDTISCTGFKGSIPSLSICASREGASVGTMPVISV